MTTVVFKHIERFIKTQNGNKIKPLSAENITRYFEAPDRQNRLEDGNNTGWIRPGSLVLITLQRLVC